MTDKEPGTDVPAGRFSALQSRDFRLLWIGQGISGIGSLMQVWAINWQLYALTHKPIALGLIGLFRVVPIVILSLIGGSVADFADRRKVMLATQSSLAAVACALGVLTLTHHLNAFWIYLLTMVGASAMAFDNPSRQALIPSLVKREHLANALSMMSVVFRTSTIIGPVLAGLLIAHGGIGLTYGINAVSFLAVIWALIAMRPGTSPQPSPWKGEGEEPCMEPAAPTANRVTVEAIKEGLVFVKSTPVLVSTMVLDFLATFFSSANALLPIFAKDILHVGPEGYGTLAAAEAVGALVAGFFLSFLPPIKKQGLTILASVTLYGVATVIFGASKAFLLSWLAMAIVGASDAVSTVLRQTIRQLATPDRLRGRMTSVNMIFFMGGPQLGELEAGLVAQWCGAPLSVIVGGVGCLVTVAVVAMKAKVLRTYEFDPGRPIASET